MSISHLYYGDKMSADIEELERDSIIQIVLDYLNLKTLKILKLIFTDLISRLRFTGMVHRKVLLRIFPAQKMK